MFSTCPFVCVSVRPSIRPFVSYQTRERDILKTSDPILIQLARDPGA